GLESWEERLVEQEQKKIKGGLTQPRNLATLLSVLFPGLGQLYNLRILKGILLIILSTSFLVTTCNYIDIGLWGIFTLGTIPKEHHSIQLLLQGLIALIVLSFVIAFNIFNIFYALSIALLNEKVNNIPKL